MSQGGYKGPSQSSGGGGGTVVVIILVIGAVLGLGCLGVCGLGLFGFSFAAHQAGQQMQQAGAAAGVSIEEALGQAVLIGLASDMIVNDARVKEALGEPVSIEGGEPPAEAASGNSHSFDLPLSGPKGKATGHVEGQRNASGWEVVSVKVTLSDGSTIDVNHNSPPAGDATPALPPEITDPPPSSDSETTP